MTLAKLETVKPKALLALSGRVVTGGGRVGCEVVNARIRSRL